MPIYDTSDKTPIRLLIDPPASGAWNMSVDQALLETVDRSGQMTIRFYQWSEPTLSLGYFQSCHDRSQHPPSLSCQWVRRATGGGAIVHDHELTYSLFVPTESRWSSENEQLYSAIHRTIIGLLDELGVSANLHVAMNQPKSVGEPSPPNPFLCFQRRANGDVIVGQHKVAGSAQRRKQRALLQHGSWLLRRSEHAPELPGIADLIAPSKSPLPNPDTLIESWIRKIQLDFGIPLILGQLASSEREQADLLVRTRFDNRDWNESR